MSYHLSLPTLLELLLFLPELVEGSRGKSINATPPHHSDSPEQA